MITVTVKINKGRTGAGRLQQCRGSLLACHLSAPPIPQYGVNSVPGSRHGRADSFKPGQVGERVRSGRHELIVPRRPGSRRAGIPT